MLLILPNPVNGLRVAIDPADVVIVTEHQGADADSEKCCFVVLRNGFQITLRDPDREVLDSINNSRMFGCTDADEPR